jgi:hypothetical protein
MPRGELFDGAKLACRPAYAGATPEGVIRYLTTGRLFVLVVPFLVRLAPNPLFGQEAPPGSPGGGGTGKTCGKPAVTSATTASGLATAPVERWRLPLDLSQQCAPLGPLIADGMMFLCTSRDQRFLVLDLATGSERWQADVGMAGGVGADLNAAIGSGVLDIVGTAGELISGDAGAGRGQSSSKRISSLISSSSSMTIRMVRAGLPMTSA